MIVCDNSHLYHQCRQMLSRGSKQVKPYITQRVHKTTAQTY